MVPKMYIVVACKMIRTNIIIIIVSTRETEKSLELLLPL